MPEAGCALARGFATLARRAPRTPAILDADGVLVATRGELAAQALALAAGLRGSIPAGAPVVVSLANGEPLVRAFVAVRTTGSPVALVDASAPADELWRCAATVGAAAIVAEEGRLPRSAAWNGGDLAMAVVDTDRVLLPARTALLKLTSGSTGIPRAVAVGVRELARDTAQIISTMAIPTAEVTLAAIPLTHSYGIGSCLVPLLLTGAPLAFPSCSLPAALTHTLTRARIAHFPAVPAMIRAISQLGDLPRFPALAVCLSAGAPLAPEDAAAFHAATGVKVHVFYGSSECGGITFDRGRAPVHERGAVGTALDGVRVEVIDERGETRTVGEEGRIRVRSRAVARGIVPRDRDPVVADGTFLSSDLGVLDDGGRLTLTGRIAEVLNVAGKKVHPEEVRRVLEAIPGVRAALVVGLHDPRRGQVVGAVVAVAREAGLTSEAVLVACRGALAPHKLPRRLVLVDELPASDRGKVRHDAVLALLQSAPRQTPPGP